VSDEETFNTVQFFEDGSYEYVRRNVSGQEAVEASHHYCTSVGARIGTTRRVIVTDSGDCTVFEWRFGEGIVYPTKAEGATFPDAKEAGPPKEWSLESNLKEFGGGLKGLRRRA
jgi:hypothetical protein